ncbi:MAG: hypothetical protein C4554_07230 [Dethiobacter sp.]|nr:MAG: hypothetical protein C4554_07230 [Dethiobacter sp.]
MMNHPLKEKIINELDRLSQEQQKKLLDYVLTLKMSNKKAVKGEKLLDFSGAISKEDLAVMEKSIKEGCEKVDLNEW